MNNPWVLFDVSLLAHRAMYTMGKLEHDDVPTGVLYGVFEGILKVCMDKRIHSNKVGLFFDSRQSYRREAFPFYKRKRREERTEEDWERIKIMAAQVRRLRKEVLPECGFPCYRQVGLESDDLIAYAAKNLPLIEDAVIVTSDGDLYQCIRWSVSFMEPSGKLFLDPQSFIAHKGIDASLWGEVKAIGGCRGDNVPGIPGIAEKSAVDYLTNLLPRSRKRHKDIESEQGQEVIKRNRQLVILPHAKTKDFSLRAPAFNPDLFFKWCDRLGIQPYLEGRRRREWERFFEGKLGYEQVARVRGEKRK